MLMSQLMLIWTREVSWLWLPAIWLAEGCPRLAVAAGSAINTRRSTSHITTPIHYVAYIYRKVHKSGIQKLTAYNILEHGHKYIHQKTQKPMKHPETS